MKTLLLPLLLLLSLNVEPKPYGYTKREIFMVGFYRGFHACYEIYKAMGQVTTVNDTEVQRRFLQRKAAEFYWFDNYYMKDR